VTAPELVSPFGPTRLPRQAATDLAGVMKVYADPTRLMILSLLHNTPDGMHVAEVGTHIGHLKQPTVSHHLHILVAAGLVDRVKDGPYGVHRLNAERAATIAALFKFGGRR
jgi:ArsR family transcriptional regulator